MDTITIPIKELEHLLSEIDKVARTFNSLLQQGEPGVKSVSSNTSEGTITLSGFASEFLTNARGNYTEKTQNVFRTAFNELRRILGDVQLRHISGREIERFLTIKKEEASDWTARKHYTALASAFEAAKKWGYITRNPWREVRKPKAREVQPLHLTRTEFEKLLTTINDRNFREVCICAVLTGMRQGELLSLRWSDVDLDNRLIHVRNSEVFTTKNKRNRLIPMNETLHKMLSHRKHATSCDFVFHRNGRPLNPDPVSRGFKRAVRRAGLNDKLHFHSLRHTFATWLVESSVSLYHVQKILGHSNFSTTQAYSHILPENLHDAVDKVSFEFK
jgi:integrase